MMNQYPARILMNDFLGAERVKLRRLVVAALLRHGPEDVDASPLATAGYCLCGEFVSGALRSHTASAVAVEAGLDLEYVHAVLAAHQSAVPAAGEVWCECGGSYSETAYGAERHLGNALVGNLPAAELHHALSICRGA